MQYRIDSWHRRLGLEALTGLITRKICYDLTPYIGGPATGGRNAFLETNCQDRIVLEYKRARGDNNRIAITSCISGAYDLLILPCRLLSSADYICFTDRPLHDWGVFRIKPIDFLDSDPVRSARFLKTHLHWYLGDYDTVIWLDANAIVHGDLQHYVEAFFESNKAFAAVPHPCRNTVYEEAAACKAGCRDDPQTIDAQMARYRREGFECDNLIETGFFICRPKDELFRRFCDHWWSEIDKHSRRDQLSINYALRKAGLEWSWLMNKGESLRDHRDFRLSAHNETEPEAERIFCSFGSVINPYQGQSYARLKRQRLARQRERDVDIVICVHDALDHVKRCLSSLMPTLGLRHRLLVVDDGSGSQTATWLRDVAAANDRMLLVRNEFRLGYTKAANIGLRSSQASFVILLNSDTIVMRDWIEKLCDAAFASEDIGIVGPLSNAASFQSIPNHLGDRNQTAINEIPAHISIERLDRWCEEWTVGCILPRLPLIHGFCFGIKREVIDRIGLLDEESFPGGYGEENDYCFRATDAGFGLVVATHTYVFHAKSKSYSADERVRLMTSGMTALMAKHGEERVKRATLTMMSNPILQIFRDNARERYRARS